ncbi:hypothetical protein [Streptomyces sp. H27-D2]|uniref:hypothetical protein n=1 Tax=Streptomyces sp. H27-D2 TaxID=3046304 RepID=UPI002DBCA5CE|nr:hypothetical protein [Streptomyces sp. H27-D2]MEC4019264.1 hypothetical protein [Streptomyces sp. H27-D2]
MLWEAIGFVIVGLALAHAATRWLPRRLPSHQLVLATGPGAALFGGVIAHHILGSGHAPATLLASLCVAVALLSLLLRPEGRPQRSAAA